VVKQLISKGHKINGARVLIMGATFKENVSDIRNSRVADVYKELRSFSVNVDVADPHASSEELMEEYGYGLVDKIENKYEAVILAVNHHEYMKLDEAYFKSIMVEDPLFVDVKGVFRDKISDLPYWSL
jgi:UDP-N-acetyl-D-galactosamine dehydrogenase